MDQSLFGIEIYMGRKYSDPPPKKKKYSRKKNPDLSREGPTSLRVNRIENTSTWPVCFQLFKMSQNNKSVDNPEKQR